jgi:RNAse (barnase) inhibitor barstar
VEIFIPQTFHFGGMHQVPISEDTLVGRINRGISGADRLLDCIAKALSFPAYFGHNWNALYDCLSDFHWTEATRVFLVHDDLPKLSLQDLRVYLEILKDAATNWKPGEAHELHVVFAKRDEETVLAILSSAS